MAMRLVGRDPSVLLVSEGLGPKRWHGQVVILINEHMVSAGEMLAAFAPRSNWRSSSELKQQADYSGVRV